MSTDYGLGEAVTLILESNKKASACIHAEALNLLAPRPGLEPGTCGLTVRCSTN